MNIQWAKTMPPRDKYCGEVFLIINNNMRISPNFKQAGTHIPMLLKIIPKTKGDVCEMGAGFNSTPVLHWLCQGRRLITYESDPGYFQFAKKFQTRTHRIRKIDDWKDVDFTHHWSVVFIDHSVSKESKRKGMQRGDDAIKFINADILILHDTEPESINNYRYNIVFPKFKYRKDWTECKPHTSVVSNVIDVTKW